MGQNPSVQQHTTSDIAGGSVVSKSKLPPTTHENHKYIGTLDWILGIYPTDTCKHVKWPVHKRTDDSITGYGKRLDTI